MHDFPGPPPHDLLFVYGTLRRGCATPWARRLARESSWLGEAHVRGRLYRIDGYPGLVVTETGGTVRGDLLRLNDPAETLAWLDAYEETGPAFPEPWEYRRVAAPVHQGGRGERRAWTYVYDWPVTELQPLADGDWLSA